MAQQLWSKLPGWARVLAVAVTAALSGTLLRWGAGWWSRRRRGALRSVADQGKPEDSGIEQSEAE